MTTTPDRLEVIKARLAVATPGPWQIYDSCSWRRIGLKGEYETIIQPVVCSDGHPDLSAKNQDDYALIVHAPEDIQYLITEVESLRHDITRHIEIATTECNRAEAAEVEVVRLRDIIDCGCNALTDSIKASGNSVETNMHWVRKMRRNGLGEPTAPARGPVHPDDSQ